MTASFRPLLVPLLLLAIWLSMMGLGTAAWDQELLSLLYNVDRPQLRWVMHYVTIAGDWETLLAITGIAALLLIYRRQFRDSFLLLAVTLSGRLFIVLQKIAAGRSRPEEPEHLVEVQSLSFPSGHAANSMMVFLSLALIVAPEKSRGLAVALALVGTMLVGLSRPILGVHWPSDVIAGWAFGAAWVLILTRSVSR